MFRANLRTQELHNASVIREVATAVEKVLLISSACMLSGWTALSSAGVVLLPTDISVAATAQETTGLHPGDRITFDLSVTNLGPEPANGLLIRTSPIVDELDVFSASAKDCAGDVVLGIADLGNSYYYTFGWHPGPLGSDIEVGQTLSCKLSIDYASAAPSVFPVTFQFSSYLTDQNPSNNAAVVVLHRAVASATPVPVFSLGGMILLSLSLMLLGAARSSTSYSGRRLDRRHL
jgi:uncharacterized repeat protein (TIGR01451 family)